QSSKFLIRPRLLTAVAGCYDPRTSQMADSFRTDRGLAADFSRKAPAFFSQFWPVFLRFLRELFGKYPYLFGKSSGNVRKNGLFFGKFPVSGQSRSCTRQKVPAPALPFVPDLS